MLTSHIQILDNVNKYTYKYELLYNHRNKHNQIGGYTIVYIVY